MCKYLSYSDILTKVALLDRRSSKSVKDFHAVNSMWINQVVDEWVPAEERVPYQDEGGELKVLERYPQIGELLEAYKKEQESADESNLCVFDVLKFGVEKERRIRGLFKRLLEVSKDQRHHSGQHLEHKYLRPYERRKNFSLRNKPKDIPFELHVYLRSHYL